MAVRGDVGANLLIGPSGAKPAGRGRARPLRDACAAKQDFTDRHAQVAGVDLGSRTIKVVVLERGQVVGSAITDTGPDMTARARKLLEPYDPARIVATGYGRHLAAADFAHEAVTEITAYALGARHLFPACRTVIDVGGQDSKAIALDERAGFRDFEMNDRCAAGTGRFLEIMARALGFSVESFGDAALEADHPVAISSVCTVFAETEVISLLARNENPRNIALGIHHAIADRLAIMVGRVGARPEVVFAGGVALNPCIVRLLGERLGVDLRVPEGPQLVGALGAALRAGAE
jgi:predicted CoA-substrate-specific enzyme activase